MCTHLLLFLLLLTATTTTTTTLAQRKSSPDADALLRLKRSLKLPQPDPLSSWSPSSDPCNPSSPWPYVTCEDGALTGIRLEHLRLSGTIDVDALLSISTLRSVSFIDNDFSGPIPEFNRVEALRSIFISSNKFSGPIPDDYFGPLTHIKKVYFDVNAFTGPIPSSINSATNLLELHLEHNQFTGEIPSLDIPSLSDLNLAENQLTGPIPNNLRDKFSKAELFEGNPSLCGAPLSTPCSGGGDNKKGSGVSKTAVIMIIGLLILFAVLAGFAAVRSRQRDIEFDTLRIETDAEAVEAAAAVESCQKEYGTNVGGRSVKRGSNRGGGGGGGAGTKAADLVMVNEEKGVFAMGDLMKASAEVLGNGGLGSAYKAVMGNGAVVAVKRTRELNRAGKDAFDGEMRRFGRLRHRNVLPLLAYHFRKEEKLVVSEFIPRGSLLYILHGKCVKMAKDNNS